MNIPLHETKQLTKLHTVAEKKTFFVQERAQHAQPLICLVFLPGCCLPSKSDLHQWSPKFIKYFRPITLALRDIAID
jgi:hypothetical protein